MLTQTDLATIFNPPLTVESRIKQTIPTLFEENEDEVSPYLEYRWDFDGYCRDILKCHSPWEQQSDVADAYILSLRQQYEKDDFEKGLVALDDLEYWWPGKTIQRWISIDAGNTSGKCVAASEYITLADGRRVKAGQLIGHKFELLTLKDGQVIPVQAEAEFNAIESVYKIITSKGREIVRNAQHPLWVADAVFKPSKRPRVTPVGWKALSEIKPDQLVAVTETLPAFGQKSTLSDDEIKTLAYLIGDGGYTRNGIVFSQQKNKQLAELTECVERLGCTVIYQNQYDYRIVGPGVNRKQPMKDRKNPIIELLRTHRLMGKHSRDKFIPEEIFVQSADKIKLFLSRLFSTDGWATLSKSGVREIGFCSASEQLVRDIQELLVRFGIHSKVYLKNKVNAWILVINDADTIVAFSDQITIYGKEEAQDRLYQDCLPTAQRRAKIARDRPRDILWRHKQALPGTIWEKVVSVERVGIEPTVAIEVPEHHTYLTMFYEHNTWILAKLVSHFFDCFTPSIVYCFAPTAVQINDLLFKEIRVDRMGRDDLPGTVLPRATRINYRPNHFVTGKATSNNTGAGVERVQGQHEKFQLFCLDEAEGIPDFVWNSVRSMMGGGINLGISARNPRTTTCSAHEMRNRPQTAEFTMSSLEHPNVVEGKEIIPNAVRRQYVLEMLEEYAEVVPVHNPDHHTFEVDWEPGVIYRPFQEFLWRVMGIASEGSASNTFCPYGRYDAALQRGKTEPFEFTDQHDKATIGVDAARYGDDAGTVYIHRGDWLWRSASFDVSDSMTFYTHIKEQMELLVADGVVIIEIRVDAGGGWGAGVVDLFKYDLELSCRGVGAVQDLRDSLQYATTKEQRERIHASLAERRKNPKSPWDNLYEFQVAEINFNGTPDKARDYSDLVTEMYYHLGAAMQRLNLRNVPKALRLDVCGREFGYGLKKGYSVKVLTPKENFKKKHSRSPDDGDGAALAVVPSYILRLKPMLLHAG